MTKSIEHLSTNKEVALATPIKKDGVSLDKVTLRKPNAGHLRGLTLLKLCELDFDAGMVLLQRISNLDERDLQNMPTENFAPLLTTIASFFVNTAQ